MLCSVWLVKVPENECVLLLVLDHDQSQLLLLEVQLRDLRPEEESDLGFPLENQDSRGSEAQAEIEKTGFKSKLRFRMFWSDQGYRFVSWVESGSTYRWIFNDILDVLHRKRRNAWTITKSVQGPGIRSSLAWDTCGRFIPGYAFWSKGRVSFRTARKPFNPIVLRIRRKAGGKDPFILFTYSGSVIQFDEF